MMFATFWNHLAMGQSMNQQKKDGSKNATQGK